MSTQDQRIKELAYRIWESEGKPHGQSERHWEMARKLAEAEAAESTPPSKKPQGKAGTPTPAPVPFPTEEVDERTELERQKAAATPKSGKGRSKPAAPTPAPVPFPTEEVDEREALERRKAKQNQPKP